MLLAGLAALCGLLGALISAKGLKSAAKRQAVLGLLINIGVMGGVIYGFTSAKTSEPSSIASAPSSTGELPQSQTNTVAATNLIASTASIDVTPSSFAKADHPIPTTTRTALLRARTAKPKPKPKPAPTVAKVFKLVVEPDPLPPQIDTAGVPTLDALLATLDLPPMPRATPLVAQRPRTFRGATLETFDEINLVSKNFQTVSQTLNVWQLLDVDGMSNERVISARRKQILAWLEHYVAFKTTVERSDTTYAERLKAINTPAKKLNTTITRFREMRDKTYGPTLRQSAVASQINTAAEGALRVLEENFAAWRLGKSGKELLFADQKTATAYSGAIERLNQASALLRAN